MTERERPGAVPAGGPRPRSEAARVLVSLGVMILMALVVYFFNVPNPNMILITGLSAFTALYGYPSGIACGAVIVLYSMFFFSTDHSFLSYTPLNLQKMAVILVGVALNTSFIGHLHRQNREANRRLEEANSLLRSDNLTLEEASITDTLTGLRNRFAIRRDYSRFDNRDVHVMMMDIDDFKHINDTYGHPVGDYILRKMGQIVINAFGGEHCYRYGGDEFLIISPDADPDAFAAQVERALRESASISLNDKLLSVHMSAGFVHGRCELSYDLRLMMHQADYNLYEAKRQGKDRYMGAPYDRDFAQTLERRAETGTGQTDML